MSASRPLVVDDSLAGFHYNVSDMSLDFIRDTAEFERLRQALESAREGFSVTGVVEPAKPYFLAALQRELKHNLVIIRPFSSSLYRFAEECRFYISQLGLSVNTHVLPPFSEDPYQDIEASLETVSARMRCFQAIISDQVNLVVTNVLGLLKPWPIQEDMQDSFLSLEKGQTFSRDGFIQNLKIYGYEHQDIINAHGECSWRGGIVDVFSPWSSYPFRLEFSGNDIVSLREFDPSSQKSVRHIERVVIPSLREFRATCNFLKEWEDLARSSAKPQFLPDLEEKIADIKSGHFFPNFGYQSVLHRSHFVSVMEYLSHTTFMIDEFEEVENEWKKKYVVLKEQFTEQQKQNMFCLPPDKIFFTSLWTQIKQKALCLNTLESERPRGKIHFFFQSAPRFENKIPFFLDYLKKRQEERERCFIFFPSNGVRKKFFDLLFQHQIPVRESENALASSRDESAILLRGDLRHGFVYPPQKIIYFSEQDIFTEERILISRPRIKPFISDFRDLQAGDYVVHTDYGIGKFNGLVKLNVDDKPEDVIEIKYREDDKLFVPMEDLSLVQRYARMGTSTPILSKLGTLQWEKTKARTIKAIEDMAKELLELYAQRRAVKGYRFSLEGTWQTDFAKTFEYQETDDQVRAIKEIMADMESESPMDRLLCGDVGYGKTEVAMRAAFKAVMDGKQVAVLCPTTVLSSQHLKTFRNRMLLFPIRIEGLSRLQTRSQQKKIVEDLKKGLVDIVIGTHRLLSKDVEFHDLGLLVVDEEQRFGVKHKEKIKQMKANIDVLTMTATPIPRTLNLSLTHLRDISLIETPPKDRLAIHTVVTSFNRQLISSAIRKELSRGGQVYFIHNRVDDIEAMAHMIENWVPEARIVTVHGQMPAKSLEEKMIKFIQGEFNVLISTTIIENGIDIPLVNTLIVNRADRFGLAQLYQLRGRVGRSSRQAVAYFLAPPISGLSGLAKVRLKALQEFSELGSGFRLAAKDLEIRGAGNFLGAKQHGYIEAVGFDYYMSLLEKTIRQMKGEEVEEVKSKLNLKIDVRIPEDYLPQVNLRLNLYKRISSVESQEDLNSIREEVKDRYGPLPPTVKNLFQYGEIRYLAGKLHIESLDRIGDKLIFKFLPDSSADLHQLSQLLERFSGSITPQGVLNLWVSGQGEREFLDETIYILKELTLI